MRKSGIALRNMLLSCLYLTPLHRTPGCRRRLCPQVGCGLRGASCAGEPPKHSSAATTRRSSRLPLRMAVVEKEEPIRKSRLTEERLVVILR